MAAKRGAKRIMQELSQLEADPSADFTAGPTEDDLFHWHFTLRLKNDEFAGGIYHGKLLLPPEYPLRPPEIYLLTPNGRFELNKRICLSITGFHEDSWQPAWGIRTALLSLSAFFSTEAKGAIAGLDAPPAERRRLARASPEWKCPTCNRRNVDLLPRDAPETEPTTVEVPSTALTGARLIGTSDATSMAGQAVVPAGDRSEVLSTIAAPMTHAPPTLLDRFIVLLLVAIVGLLARQLS